MNESLCMNIICLAVIYWKDKRDDFMLTTCIGDGDTVLRKSGEEALIPRDHSFSTYAKFSKKLAFLTPSYAHVRVRIRG